MRYETWRSSIDQRQPTTQLPICVRTFALPQSQEPACTDCGAAVSGCGLACRAVGTSSLSHRMECRWEASSEPYARDAEKITSRHSSSKPMLCGTSHAQHIAQLLASALASKTLSGHKRPHNEAKVRHTTREDLHSFTIAPTVLDLDAL